jgi:AmmeMemoRadiSam system protein A
MDLSIPHDARRSLLDLARASIRDAILKDGSLEIAMEKTEITPPMLAERGLFVTIKEADRRLRGCIGTMSSRKPLYRTVIDTAPRAALEDPRFSPLGGEELEGVRISLSVLSPLRPLRDTAELVLGRDGLQLELREYRSVFLPQVATEQGWGRHQFLERLAMKAGLAKDAWREASLSVFEAVVFEE